MMYDWQVSFAENQALSVAIGGSGTELGENPAAPAPVLRALCLSHILAQLGQEIAPQGTPATQFGLRQKTAGVVVTGAPWSSSGQSSTELAGCDTSFLLCVCIS